MSVEPRATYRLQLEPRFGFESATAILDYLAALGVSHVYLSPCLQAAHGSTHGYDVVDHHRVRAELGGEPGYDRLCERLRQLRLGQLLDIVPNHMAIAGGDNRWWSDVLENGPSSHYAAYFDVDWEPTESRLRNTVLLPVLHDHYGRVLEAGELRLFRSGGAFAVGYRDQRFPAAPRSLAAPLAAAAVRCGSDELAFLADALEALPLPTATDRASTRRRHRDKEILQRQLARLLADETAVADAVDAQLAELSADVDALDELLSRQNYRLAYWRAAAHDLGYRRFFDINTLIGLRVEDEQVFADTHALILRWYEQRRLAGLRVDHPDGLRDPKQYLQRLRDACPDAWIVVEKILAGDETLPEDWPVAGTTGYDFLNLLGGLFVDPSAESALTALYADVIGDAADWHDLVRDRKRMTLRELLGADLKRLTELLLQICERHRRYRDFTRPELHLALGEIAASLSVYRTYVRAEHGEANEVDTRRINAAVEEARQHRPEVDSDLFDFVRDILSLHVGGELEGELSMRFQQLTGPVSAKGVEDTALYAFHRLVSSNEVGGDPDHFGASPREFHRWCSYTAAHWPRTMLATSTHDTKRSEEVRARLCVLSEIPDEWSATVRRWIETNQGHRRDGLPDRNAEYLFYQTIVGAWPISPERAVAYMEKAAREAKVHTSWTQPDHRYEEALRSFVTATLAAPAFREDVEGFVQRVLEPGRINSLAQTLIKLTAPGVPDIYQGTELWDLSLVDPDNRRPVDYRLRRSLLAELDGMSPEEVWARADEGLPKLWVIRRALDLRHQRPQLFDAAASYRPLPAAGAKAGHVVAFLRAQGAVTAVPRLFLRLGGSWQDTTVEVPSGRWCHQLTGDVFEGGTLSVDRLFARFPVCLLWRTEQP